MNNNTQSLLNAVLDFVNDSTGNVDINNYKTYEKTLNKLFASFGFHNCKFVAYVDADNAQTSFIPNNKNATFALCTLGTDYVNANVTSDAIYLN